MKTTKNLLSVDNSPLSDGTVPNVSAIKYAINTVCDEVSHETFKNPQEVGDVRSILLCVAGALIREEDNPEAIPAAIAGLMFSNIILMNAIKNLEAEVKRLKSFVPNS